MPDSTRYQQFLRETLQKGLVDLENNPSALEIVGIPRSSFEIFVRAFRHGLPDNIQKNLPPHNLTNKKYLQILSQQIETLLQKPIEAERILSNMPPLENLERAYTIAQQRQTKAVAQHRSWQQTFEQQIKQYNLDLISRLDQQVQKEFPSLINNPAKRKILVADMARTIQDQGLRGIKGDYETQAKKVIQEVAQQTIKQYASEIEELQDSKAEENISQVAQRVATVETQEAFRLRRGQIRAETTPENDPAYNLTSTIQTSVIANLPPQLAQNEELVKAITGEIEATIYQTTGGAQNYQQQVAANVYRIISQGKNVLNRMEQAGVSTKQAQQIANSVAVPISEQIAPVIYETASSSNFANTPFAGSIAGGPSAGPGPSGGDGHPSGAGNLYSINRIPEGSIEDVFFSSGQPLHAVTALLSPHSLQDTVKWALTGGPVKSIVGFLYDSTPGVSHLNYFNLGLGLMFQSQKQLKEKLAELANKTGYGARRERQECQTRLSFLNEQIGRLQKIPGFNKFYNFYYGSLPGRLLHPLDSLQLWAINKNIFAGLGVSGVVQTLSWTAQYGPAGFAYGVEQMPVQLGLLALKWGLSKTGLYKVVGLPGSRHYVFTPTYELGLRFKHLLYKKVLQPIKHGLGRGLIALGKKLKIPGLVSFGKKIITGVIGKFMAALMKFLGILGMAWGLIKALWNKVIKPAALALIFLILSKGVPAIAGAIGGAIVGLPVAFQAAAWTFGFFSPFISPFLAWIPASVVFVAVDLIFALAGSGVTVFLSDAFTNMVSGGFGGIPTLPNFGPVFSGYVAPVLITTGATVAGGTILINITTSSAFWLPGKETNQSGYIKLEKTPSFSGTVGDQIKYSLTISAPKKTLKNIGVNDKISFLCKDSPPPVPALDYGKIPAEIPSGSSITLNYAISSYTSSRLNDCLVTNTATVTADVENGPTGEESFAIATVTIGNPPVSVPSIWPLASGCITQGPEGSTTHAAYHEEAIDIDSAANGKPVLAAHNGTVIKAVNNQTFSTIGYGNYVVISGNGGKDVGAFTTIYAHLQGDVLVTAGQTVRAGQQIGRVGSSGNTSTPPDPPAPHLHYELTNLKLVPPYLPKDISSIRGCDGKTNCNLCFP